MQPNLKEYASCTWDSLGVDKAGDVVIGRFVNQIVEQPVLHDPAIGEEENAVAEEAGFPHIMCDHDRRLFQCLKNIAQVFLQIVSDQRIESPIGSSSKMTGGSIIKARMIPTLAVVRPTFAKGIDRARFSVDELNPLTL